MELFKKCITRHVGCHMPSSEYLSLFLEGACYYVRSLSWPKIGTTMQHITTCGLGVFDDMSLHCDTTQGKATF